MSAAPAEPLERRLGFGEASRAGWVEGDAGEVMKAVSATIEPIQAMLMAGILAYGQLEEAEAT